VGRVFYSKVQKSKSDSESLRATIPEAAAAALGIKEGDLLAWEVEGGWRGWL
jgi:hypothetical protein